MSKKIIEDVINDMLKDDSLKYILDLMVWLRENKMNPLQSSASTWKISCNACVVCYFRFNFNSCTLHIHPIIGDYKYTSLSDNLKEIVWKKKKKGTFCERCHACSYKLKAIFEREYNDACGQSVSFINPNVNEIECIKELLKMRVNVIKNGYLLPTLPKNFR